MRRSTRRSVVNLNVRGLAARQKVFFPFLRAIRLCSQRRSRTLIHHIRPLSLCFWHSSFFPAFLPSFLPLFFFCSSQPQFAPICRSFFPPSLIPSLLSLCLHWLVDSPGQGYALQLGCDCISMAGNSFSEDLYNLL